VLEDMDKGKLVTWASFALLVLAIALRLHAHGGGGAPPATISPAPAGGARAPAAAPSPASRELWVDVAGAVRRPGLYKVPSGSRLAAALERAGGVSRRGDQAGVNLASPLHDGQQVIVPLRGAAGGAAATAGAGGGAGGPASGPISLGQATEAQLETLDGIGPALAGRIIEYRQQHGGFRSIEELKEVSGIGDKRFAALRGSIAP
jgi:competence protein ComEA